MMRFADYRELKKYLWEEYRPIPAEKKIRDASLGYRPGADWAKANAPRFFRALKAVEAHGRPGARLLDIGSYPGSFPRLLKIAFKDAVAVSSCGMPVEEECARDLAREGIEFTACNLDPDIKIAKPLPEGLPFKTESFDAVTGLELIEHLYSAKTLMTEAYRILKPGGILYLTTDNVANREGLLRVFKGGTTNLDNELAQTSIWSDGSNLWRGHVRFYSLPQLREIGAKAGFEALREGYFQHYEDPDVNHWNSRGLLGLIRRRLRGDGSRAPIRLRSLLQSLIHLGPLSLSPRFNDHIEIAFLKP